MHRPDSNAAHHPRAVTGIELYPSKSTSLTMEKCLTEGLYRNCFKRHYGVPEKLTSIIRNSYDGLTYRMVHRNQMTGVRQGCLLPPFFFLLAIDWVMRHPQLQTE
jgi:hypothetical protein